MPCHLELRLAIDANLFEERDLALSHQHVEHGAPQSRALPPDGLHEFITRLLCSCVSNRNTRRTPGAEVERQIGSQSPQPQRRTAILAGVLGELISLVGVL